MDDWEEEDVRWWSAWAAAEGLGETTITVGPQTMMHEGDVVDIYRRGEGASRYLVTKATKVGLSEEYELLPDPENGADEP